MITEGIGGARRGWCATGLAVLVLLVLLAGCTGSAGTAPAATEPTVPTSPTSAASTAPSESSPAASSGAEPTPTSPAITLRTVSLAPGVSDEASGVAASTTAPDRYFLIDDGTGTGDLAVVDGQGALVTRVELDGMSADNAEALAGGACGSIPLPDGASAENCLYIGDIGDNKERRDDIVIYRAAEPDLGGDPPATIDVPADEWNYTYPDGPHNAEAMLVEPDGSILVVTKPKNNAPHRMYRGAPNGGELAFVREFTIPGSTRPLRTILTGNVATDLAAASGRVLLLTYDDVHEYTSPDPNAELSTFPDWPVRSLPFPQLPQAEGIVGAADGCGYVVASEAGPGGSAGSLGFATCG